MKSVAEETDDLRALIREAHEAMKDLRVATRQAHIVVKIVESAAEEALQNGVNEASLTVLARYEASIGEAIAVATTAVYERFDRLTELLLGQTKRERRIGEPSVEEVAKVQALLEDRMSDEGIDPEEGGL